MHEQSECVWSESRCSSSCSSNMLLSCDRFRLFPDIFAWLSMKEVGKMEFDFRTLLRHVERSIDKNIKVKLRVTWKGRFRKKITRLTDVYLFVCCLIWSLKFDIFFYSEMSAFIDICWNSSNVFRWLFWSYAVKNMQCFEYFFNIFFLRLLEFAPVCVFELLYLICFPC